MKTAAKLLAILLLGACFRFIGLKWDQGYMLHPDERFLLMVSNELALPDSLAEYLDPDRSPLNPYRTKFTFFVYGMLPLIILELVKAIPLIGQFDLMLVARALSGVFDLGTLLLVYFLARETALRLRLPKSTAFLAALFYALAVFPIQNSHFFTVDSFLVFFTTASLLCAVRYYGHGTKTSLVLGALTFGWALACKISAVFMLPVLTLLFVFTEWRPRSLRGLLRSGIIPRMLVFAVISYLTLRLTDPRLFAGMNYFVPRPNPQFLANIRELSSFASYETFFPPAIQWQSTTPVLFSLKNLAFFGLGVPYALLLGAGLIAAARKPRFLNIVLLAWLVLFFLYQSSTFVKALRYFAFLYPLFALYAAVGALAVCSSVKGGRQRWELGLCVLLAALWPISFMRIYQHPHSRVQASSWIHRQLPAGSVLAVEHWDDGLPLSIPGYHTTFSHRELPVFAPDNDEKWQEMEKKLGESDFLILSSNRGYGSIGRVPQKYPRMSRFYEELFAGTGPFTLIAEFTSYPGFETPFFTYVFEDQWADETFTVYDHPRVLIFQKKRGSSEGGGA